MRYSLLEINVPAVEAFAEKGFVCVRLKDGREIRFPVSEAAKLGATFAAKREPQNRAQDLRVPEVELVFAGAARARKGHRSRGPAPRKWPRF